MIADGVDFRRLNAADLPLLHDWIHRPHVQSWWGADDKVRTLDDMRTKYLPRLRADAAVQAFIALRAGEPIGYIQSYIAMDCGGGWWADETDPGVRGIDQFLADGERLGQGLGTEMVAAFVQRLFDDRSVTRIQTDPDPANARAIRCYEKVGFVPEGLIQTPDGAALLMTLERAQMNFSSSRR